MSQGNNATTADQPDERAAEVRKMTRLLRFVGMFVAWPAITGSLAFLLLTNDPLEHALHVFGLLPFGVGGIVLFALAPRIAQKHAAS